MLPTSRNGEARLKVESEVVEQFRARRESDPDRLEIDFPKQLAKRDAKNRVVEALDAVEPRWRRVFALYPTETALRNKRE